MEPNYRVGGQRFRNSFLKSNSNQPGRFNHQPISRVASSVENHKFILNLLADTRFHSQYLQNNASKNVKGRRLC